MGDSDTLRGGEPADDESLTDLLIYVDHWKRAVEVQVERVQQAQPGDLLDIGFLVTAASALRQCVGALSERRGHVAVATALHGFDEAHPYLRQLRNAIEHAEDYLAGSGRAAKGNAWFPLATSRYEGRLYLLIPPLGGRPAAGVDVLRLADEVSLLALKALDSR